MDSREYTYLFRNYRFVSSLLKLRISPVSLVTYVRIGSNYSQSQTDSIYLEDSNINSYWLENQRLFLKMEVILHRRLINTLGLDSLSTTKNFLASVRRIQCTDPKLWKLRLSGRLECILSDGFVIRLNIIVIIS